MLALRLLDVGIKRLLHRSDYKRWRSIANHEVWWDARTKLLAEMVPPGSKVIEFGAGRRQLERYLPPGCSYTPSDLVERGPGTIICDFNRPPLPDLTSLDLDVAVFGGVLEYVIDVPALVDWLASTVDVCVASYAYLTPEPGRLRGRWNRLKRMRFGYMNHYSEEELVALFLDGGFVCHTRRPWESQRLFLFTRAVSEPR